MDTRLSWPHEDEMARKGMVLFAIVVLGAGCAVHPDMNGRRCDAEKRCLDGYTCRNDICVSNSKNPRLGLHPAALEWLDDTHIRVMYDWTSDDQLKDWSPTPGSTLSRSNGTLTIGGGSTDVYGIRWAQPIAVSRIRAQANSASSRRHINIYTNLSPSWNGSPFDPEPSIGIIHSDRATQSPNFWILDGKMLAFAGTVLAEGVWYEFEFTVSPAMIRTWSSVDDTWSERPGTYAPSTSGIVAIGAYSGQNAWGTVIIEGEVDVQ